MMHGSYSLCTTCSAMQVPWAVRLSCLRGLQGGSSSLLPLVNLVRPRYGDNSTTNVVRGHGSDLTASSFDPCVTFGPQACSSPQIILRWTVTHASKIAACQDTLRLAGFTPRGLHNPRPLSYNRNKRQAYFSRLQGRKTSRMCSVGRSDAWSLSCRMTRPGTLVRGNLKLG